MFGNKKRLEELTVNQGLIFEQLVKLTKNVHALCSELGVDIDPVITSEDSVPEEKSPLIDYHPTDKTIIPDGVNLSTGLCPSYNPKDWEHPSLANRGRRRIFVPDCLVNDTFGQVQYSLYISLKKLGITQSTTIGESPDNDRRYQEMAAKAADLARTIYNHVTHYKYHPNTTNSGIGQLHRAIMDSPECIRRNMHRTHPSTISNIVNARAYSTSTDDVSRTTSPNALQHFIIILQAYKETNGI